ARDAAGLAGDARPVRLRGGPARTDDRAPEGRSPQRRDDRLRQLPDAPVRRCACSLRHRSGGRDRRSRSDRRPLAGHGARLRDHRLARGVRGLPGDALAGADPLGRAGHRVGVVARANLADGARWFDAHACMAWHMMNAFDDGGAIRIDLCEQAAPAFPTPDGRPNPDPLLQQRLARWTIDLGGGSLSVERLSETVCEYPRIDERRTGLPYRYGFVAAEGGPGTGDMSHRAIGRFDHETGALTLWRPGAGQAVSEPVFVAARPNAPEGVGWLLATVFDEASDASHLAVLDAERVDRGPLARARLGHRVPAGFHGSFAA